MKRRRVHNPKIALPVRHITRVRRSFRYKHPDPASQAEAVKRSARSRVRRKRFFRYKSEWLGVFPCLPDLKRGDQTGMESMEAAVIMDRKEPLVEPSARGHFLNALSRQLQPSEKRVPNTQQLAYTSQRSGRRRTR
ncbi:hypothetical protein DPX16_18215 [Anabarilius grahami]|uniref:Uncharacterized protein n=1 Tax=Anabarilius grahami TaxID=495550 RepID=A0A3N0Y7V3_ANAGA|nr:hypothetical protein DPX16_18215 [Anabarilius grahami]